MKPRARFGFLRIFAILAAPLAAACPGDDPADAGGELQVELGTGTVAYAPLGADDDLELIAGPQGGHHFVVHARAQDILPGDPSRPGQLGNPATSFGAYTEQDERIDLDFPPYRLGYEVADDGWAYLPSGRILQVQEEVVPQLPGQRVRITVQVKDARGHVGSDERWVRVIEEQDRPDAGPADAGAADAGVAADAGS